MKLPFSWRRRPATETKATGPETPAPAEPPIDITIHRECHLRSFKGDPGPCPRCGGPLRQSRQTYLITTRQGRRMTDPFIMGSDFGWFCANCPTVVINAAEIDESAKTEITSLHEPCEMMIALI